MTASRGVDRFIEDGSAAPAGGQLTMGRPTPLSAHRLSRQSPPRPRAAGPCRKRCRRRRKMSASRTCRARPTVAFSTSCALTAASWTNWPKRSASKPDATRAVCHTDGSSSFLGSTTCAGTSHRRSARKPEPRRRDSAAHQGEGVDRKERIGPEAFDTVALDEARRLEALVFELVFDARERLSRRPVAGQF